MEKKEDSFDDEFDDGIYVIPRLKCLPQYSIRGTAQYMEKNKIGDPLIEDELKQSRIEPRGFICRQVKTTTIIASHLSISGLKVDMSSLKKHGSRKQRDAEYKERCDVYG